MPAITLSNGFISGANGVMERMMSYNSSPVNWQGGNNITGLLSRGGPDPYQSGYYRSGVISIMKGEVPANFTTLTGYSSRSADVLVQWTIVNGQFGSSAVTTNPAVINTSFATASASGTATWFWWVTRGWMGGGWGYDNTLYEQMIGTVGLPGTGADLEIPSTSVTSNQLFRIIDLRMQIATSYSY